MTKIKLKEICKYVYESVEVGSIKLENYVSTDNMLPNKAGITLSEKLPPQKMCKKFQKGDILVSNIRPYFKKIWFAEFDGGCSADVLVLKTVNPKFDPKFVYYNLFQDLFFKHQMAGAKGSKMPRGDKDQIMEFLIPKFDKNYQKNISDLLTVIDEKIQLNKKINTELENLAKTIYNYWFVQFDFPYDFEKNEPCTHSPEDKKQNKCHCKPYKTSGGEMVWNEALRREIPKGWEVHNLKSNPITEIIKPGISKFEGEKTYLPTAEVNDLNINFFAEKITYENRETRANMQPVENSVWFAKMKKSKKIIFVGEYSKYLINNFIFSTGFLGLKCNEGFLEYLLCFILSDKFEEMKDNLASGATQQAINNDSLAFIPIIIPNEFIIKNFHHLTYEVFKKIYFNFLENYELTKFRDFLLPLLMNGQVKVKSEAILRQAQDDLLRQAQDEMNMAAEPKVEYGK